MQNTSKRRNISRISTIFLLLAIVGAAFTAIDAQPPAKSSEKIGNVRDVLSRMAETGGLGPVDFLRNQAIHNPATVDSLVTGLERLVFTAKTPIRRSEAAIALAVAGTGEVPLRGIVNRLTTAYRRSPDAEVRGAIITMMAMQKDKRRAIAFLKFIAAEDSEHQDFSGASLGAVTALSKMNGEGLVALKELRDAGAVTDPRARGYIAWFLNDKGKQ